MNSTGNIFVVTAPSGAGKTTLVAALLAADKQIQLSVSYTTRAPRDGEIPGVHYHFVDRASFDQLKARGDFWNRPRSMAMVMQLPNVGFANN